MKLFRFILILMSFNSCNLEVIPDEVVAGSISALNCSGATVSGTLVSGQIATNISVSVPYTGGDGGTHSGQTVLSTGVTGLTAKLDAGSFDTGSGILDYAVSGTPSASGNAIFELNIGGKTCLLPVPVQALIGSITGLNCSGATTNGALYVNQAASNVSVAVPYTGGNGGAYTGQSVTSTGVTGLTATLSDSIFANGDGNLVYQISGTPAASGTASFALNAGGKSCTLAVTVGISTGSIGSLNCGSATNSGTLVSGVAASNVTVTVPYTGGNGGTHGGQTVQSTGVTGLEAMLSSGSFDNGNGNVVYMISGTPSINGTASFALNIGGKNCTVAVPVNVGSIGNLDCQNITLSGTLIAGQAVNNVTVTVTYTGGNGGTHTGQTVNSSTPGVLGLTATLDSGSFSSGGGTLVYTITGTPSTSGAAMFALNIGGKMCTISLTVQVAAGTLSALNCSNATVAGTLIAGVTAGNITVTVPYTGGNGGTHGGQTVQSTGVTGLAAMLSAGSFDNGSGAVVYTITGNPLSAGTATFALDIGGKTCDMTVQVNGGSIGNLDCQNITVSGTLIAGQVANSVTVSVPYTGGNGGKHTGQIVNSSTPGVLGLTATLGSGSFTSGSGTLVYNISGTPTTSGSAMFALNIGGKMCTISLTVQAAAGTISTLNCASATVAGTLTAGIAASGVSVSVSYTGSNGGTHSGQTVVSTGITGLTATLNGGSFESGSGNLSYAISGTPSASGTANFSLDIGGKNCNLSVTVQAIAGTIGSLNCGSAYTIGTLTAGVASTGVSFSVPYDGGNGGSHSGQTATSTGITGLTATLLAGSFAGGVGILSYTISGTPATSGTANFALDIGGKNCILPVLVQVAGSIGEITCTSASLTGTLFVGVSASGVSVSVPYTGGNGNSHNGQTVTSTGVSGLTANLSAGSFTGGSGNLSYIISGTPASSGNAIFPLNIGGQTCDLYVSINLPGTCFAKINGTQTKTFMCYNLGAANTNANPFTPSWEINGGYWQWGRSAQAALGPTGPGSGQANDGAISGWNTTGAADGAWSDVSKTANDPCPAGFRVPTISQWSAVVFDNNLATDIGTWFDSATNYSSGTKIGDNLFLPATGVRNGVNGALGGRGYAGNYWGSTQAEGILDNAWCLGLEGSYNVLGYFERAFGLSVRCIAE